MTAGILKWLLVALVVAVVVALLFGRGARRRPPPRADAGGRAPATMVACAHCGVHLPRDDAQFDAAQRPYCSDAHRLAGPR